MAGKDVSSSAAAISKCPIMVALGLTRLSIPVSTDKDAWIAAEVLRGEFTHDQAAEDAIETTIELENPHEAAVELAAKFLAYITANLDADQESAPARTSVLLHVFKYFTSAYLASKDVHSLAASSDTDVRKTVLKAYFGAYAALEARAIPDISKQPQSALLTAAAEGSGSVYAIFGGQGTDEVYFDELQTLYDIYTPFVAAFIRTITEQVLSPSRTRRPHRGPTHTA